MLCADIKSTVFKITAPGLSNRHVLLLCWKNYVSCYASTSEYSSVLAHNSVDFFFFSVVCLCSGMLSLLVCVFVLLFSFPFFVAAVLTLILET